MKSRSGFTVIELVVVIAVISIITTIAIMSYRTIQAESRDAKRKADITTLVNLFESYYEKKGEYPTGCSKYIESQKQSCTYQYPSTTSNQVTSNPDAFYADTPLSTIKSVFPQVTNNFGNPSRPNDPPLKGYQASLNTPGYYYRGQIESTVASNVSSTTMSATLANEINCGSGITIYHPTFGSASGGTAFILGYWSEAENKWFIYQGKHGHELMKNAWNTPVRGTTEGQCVFVQ